MPISHLISESYYQEPKQASAQPPPSRFASHKSLPAHAHQHCGRKPSRGVTFDDDDQKYFDDELFKDSGMDSTRDHIDLGQESPTLYEEEEQFQYETQPQPHPGNNPKQDQDRFYLDREFAKLNVKNGHADCDNPILIDTDGGIYDAWALSLVLASANGNGKDRRIPTADFQLVGITTVNGSTSVNNAVKNVSRVLQEVGSPYPVPIFRGMDSSIVGQKGATPRPAFFGSDGFGDPKDLPSLESESHSAPRVEQDHAVNGIIKLAEKFQGRLTIIALGPLTNLAMAVKLRPELRNQVKELFIVGGNSEGVVNMTVCSEFNFFADPEAAQVVLEGFGSCPIYVLPWETCLRSAASTQTFRTSVIGSLGSPLVKFFNRIEANILKTHGDQWIAPEAVLMACFLHRDIMRKTENYHCTVELQGKHTRGMMIVDRNFLRQNPANVTLITEVDRNTIEKMHIEMMTIRPVDVRKQNKYNHMQEGLQEQNDNNASFKIEPNYF